MRMQITYALVESLFYSTCTLNRKENEQQIKKFLAKHSDYVLLEEETLFPMINDADGFLLRKIKA